MKRLLAFFFATCLFFGLGFLFLIDARERNTWPFDTKMGPLIPGEFKQLVYKLLTPESRSLKSYHYNLKLSFNQIPDFDYIGRGGGIEKLNGELVYIDSTGHISIFDPVQNTFEKMPSRLKGYINIRDFTFDHKNNEILIVGITKLSDKCASIELDKYSYTYVNKQFSISNKDNVWKSEQNCKFDIKLSGSRVAVLPDRYLVSTGIFQGPTNSEIIKENWPQKPHSSFGKIMSITRNGDIQVYASGLRNPQGMFVTQSPQKVFGTDHGPSGGDELNLITEGRNYGWPCISSGRLYSAKLNDESFYPDIDSIDGCSSELDYTKPTFSISQSNIGISQGLAYAGSHFSAFADNLIVSSLKGQTLFRFILDDKKEKVISYEEIPVGGRVRDITTTADGKIAFITDKGYLVVIEKNIE